MRRLNLLGYKIAKLMSKGEWHNLLAALFIFIVFSFILFICFNCIYQNHGLVENMRRFMVSMVSPALLVEASEGKGPYCFGIQLITYFFGIIFLSGFVLATITSMIINLKDRYREGTLYKRYYGHIVFLGYDDLMVGTLKHEMKSHKRKVMVAVPGDVTGTREKIGHWLSKMEGSRVQVFFAKRTDLEDLKKLNIDKSHRIYIIGQPDEPTHDAANLQCLGYVTGLCSRLEDAPECFYYFRNQSTNNLLQRQGVTVDNLKEQIIEAKCDYDRTKEKLQSFIDNNCEAFNFYHSAARNLLFNVDSFDNRLKLDWHSRDINLRKKASCRPHILIIGISEMGMALAREILLTTHYPDNKILISFVDSLAYHKMMAFVNSYSTLFDVCGFTYRNFDEPKRDIPNRLRDSNFLDVEFEFIDSDINHPKLREEIVMCSDNEDELLTIAACMDDSLKNMTFAMYLPRTVLEQRRIPVWVYQKTDNSMNSFLEHRNFTSVKIFSLMDCGVYREEVVYRWAKTLEETYEAQWGKAPVEERIARKWSSIYSAFSMLVKLRMIGYGIRLVDGMVEMYWLDGGTNINEFPENTEMLNVAEHNRWNVEKLMMGYRATTKEEQKAFEGNIFTADYLKSRFINNDIRPFDFLPQVEKEKDAVLVNALIAILRTRKKH